MKVQQEQNGLQITIEHFDVFQTLECGQCFRWKEEAGVYTGVAFGRVLHVRGTENGFTLWPCTMEEFESIWRKYFDLDRDYAGVIGLLRCDDVMCTAVEFGWGLRVLRQELWETLISFMISQNNMLPRIKSIVDQISGRWGDSIVQDGQTYYAFPTPVQLAQASEDELRECGAGYRAGFLRGAAQRVAEGYPLDTLETLDTDTARRELLTFSGIGPKVAECILLYALGREEAFPVDTWIKKAMETLYLGQKTTMNGIMSRAAELFGENAGLAQQYLFYYARQNKINGLTRKA